MSDQIRVNVKTKVRNADIRHVIHNNREHIVVPSFTLPDECVMNGGLYPADEIAKSYKGLEDTLAPVGHPTINGKHVLAKTPEAINAHHVGAFNKNVERVGTDGAKRVYLEKWIDVEKAKESELGQQLLDAIESGAPIHTSTGLVCKRELVSNQAGYQWIARDMRFDHDAILFDEPGAATPDDGVGIMVNSAELVVNAICPELVTNGALKNSYGQKREALSSAVRELFGSKDSYAYVEDFDETDVIYNTPEGFFMVSYEIDSGAVVIEGTPQAMIARSEFVAKGATVGTEFALVKNAVQLAPVTENQPPESSPMDEAQKTAFAELIGNAIKTAVEPLTAQVADLQGKLKAQSDALEANAKQVDADNRAVILAKMPGLTVTVNALSGEPLALMAAEYQDAAPIASGAKLQTNSAKSGLAAFDAYEGQD